MANSRAFRGGAVILNVYDLSPMNDCLCTLGFGAHHSGVEINGREYSFADGGVYDASPKDESQAPLRTSVNLGEVNVSSSDVDVIIARLRPAFAPGTYNVLSKNCNSFSRALVLELLNGQEIPGYVNRLAWLGSWFSCLVPDSVSGGTDNAVAMPAAPTYTAFGGSGQTLGLPSGGSTAAPEDMRARRARAMAAAEARAAAALAESAAGAGPEGMPGGLKSE